MNEQQRKQFLDSFKGIAESIKIMQDQMQTFQTEIEQKLSDEERELLKDFKKSATKVAESGDLAGLIKLKSKFLQKLNDADKQNKH